MLFNALPAIEALHASWMKAMGKEKYEAFHEALDVATTKLRSYQCPTDSCWNPVILVESGDSGGIRCIPEEWKLAEGSANIAIPVVSHSSGILTFQN